MATIGRLIRNNTQKQVQQQKAESKAAKQGKSLVSDANLAKPEPATPMGMRPVAGKYQQGYEASVSGGRHHGVVSNIADSVGYMLADHAHDNPNSTHVGTAYAAMERAYLHLGMHHSSNLQGNHEAAAAHLKHAGEAIKYAMNRIGGSLRGGVQNAYGEKASRPDLEKTIDHAVNHYATLHKVSTTGTAEIEKPLIEEAPEPTRVGARSGATNLKRDIDLGRTQTHALGGKQLEEYHRRVAASYALQGIENPNPSPGLRALNNAPVKVEMSRKDHIKKAYNDLKTGGKIHPDQMKALSEDDIDKIHDVAGVPRPYEPKMGRSLPMTPSPRDREL